mmetsp:Transcript_55190/g.124299  ORF Transcript_55190/g.124299 Transcript_55190/m.124299 type:complete len:394 (+) Transcript_55190:364-1545(+)
MHSHSLLRFHHAHAPCTCTMHAGIPHSVGSVVPRAASGQRGRRRLSSNTCSRLRNTAAHPLPSWQACWVERHGGCRRHRSRAPSARLVRCSSWPPKAPLGYLVPVQVPLRALLIHQHHTPLLQVVAHFVGFLEVGCLPSFVALLDEALDLLVCWGIRRSLAAGHVGAGRERRVPGTKEPLLRDLHRELWDGAALLLTEVLVVGVNLLELGLGILHGLVKRRLVTAGDAEGQGLIGLMGSTNALPAEPRLAAVLLELGVLPDLTSDLNHAAAHPELALVLDANLKLARVLFGPARRLRGTGTLQGRPGGIARHARGEHGRGRKGVLGSSRCHLCEHRVVRLGRKLDAKERAGHPRQLFVVEVVLSCNCLVPLAKLHLSSGPLLVNVDAEDLSIP